MATTAVPTPSRGGPSGTWTRWTFPAEIQGWLSEEEGRALATLAEGKVVLEIGSYCGRSTICLAQTARIVYALDWHRGDRDIGHSWTLPAFLDNLERHGVNQRVVPLVGRVEQLAGTLGTGWADLVFVDGAHDYASVLRDARLALSCLNPDGTLALHDYRLHPGEHDGGWNEGVTRAVRTLQDEGPLRLVQRAGTIAVLRFSDAPAL